MTTRIDLGNGNADRVIRFEDTLYAYADGTLWQFDQNNLYGDWKKAERWPEELKLVDGSLIIELDKELELEIPCDCSSRDLLHVGHKCGR